MALEKGYLGEVRSRQSQALTFLRTCLDRFLQNQRKAETALKRGGASETLSPDFPGAERELPLVSKDLRTSISSSATRPSARCSRVPWTS